MLDEETGKVPSSQKIRLINIVVFGFSRGAAEARAFVRDLAAKCTAVGGVYQYKEIDYNTIDLFYEYRVPEKFEVNLELSEISEAVWITLKELNLEDIAFDSQKKFFEEYLKNI